MQPECAAPDPVFFRNRYRPFIFGTIGSAIGLVLLVGGGCHSPSPPPTGPTNSTLRVACADPVGQALLQVHAAKLWANQSGTAVQVLPRAPADAPDADLWLIPPAELAQWAARGALRPVPDQLFAHDDPFQGERLLRIYRQILACWGQTSYALPVLGEATVALYRRDLFAAPAHQAAFQKRFHRPLPADGPTTWQDVEDMASYFASPDASAWGPGGRPASPRVSLPPLPAAAADLDRLFFSVAAPLVRLGLSEEAINHRDRGPDETAAVYAFQYDTRDGRPRLDQPGFVAALQLLQRLQAFRPTGTTEHPVEAFRDGRAVFCLVPLRELPTLGALRAQVGVCPHLPGSRMVYDFTTGQPRPVSGGNHVPYLGAGGLLGVVPARSAHATAAFALLAYLAHPRTSLEILATPNWGGGPTREALLDAADLHSALAGYDLPPAEAGKLGQCLRTTLLPPPANPTWRLRTPDQAAHRDALMSAVRAALAKPGRDAQTALKEAVAKWLELDRGHTAERLEEYKRSLGLVR